MDLVKAFLLIFVGEYIWSQLSKQEEEDPDKAMRNVAAMSFLKAMFTSVDAGTAFGLILSAIFSIVMGIWWLCLAAFGFRLVGVVMLWQYARSQVKS